MNAFKRLEFKYFIPKTTADEIYKKIENYIVPDAFGDDGGTYTISSIYYDNSYLDCYFQTLNRDIFRQKLRLRTYGTLASTDSPVFFEIKSKLSGQSTKRRYAMPYKYTPEFCEQSLSADIVIDEFLGSHPQIKDTANGRQILAEIAELICRCQLKPVSVVSYERQALIAKDRGDVRITFDSNLRVRTEDLDLLSGSYGTSTMPDDMLVLEVKQDSNVPLWLAEILCEYKCRNQSYSKYCSMNMYKAIN